MSKGHRAIPHTADIALHAWADSRDDCLAEAVRALVDSFADLGGAAPDDEVTFTAGQGEDALVALLEEVIYQVEVHGRVVADVQPGPEGGLRLATVPVEAVEQIGAMPKAVTTHGVRFEHDGQWQAHAVVDV
jgi:SHS2 domain-containing protein